MSRYLRMLFIALIVAWSLSASAANKTIETTVVGFDAVEYKRGFIKLNNFTITETKGGFMAPKGWYSINIQLSGKNKSKKRSAKIQLQVAGLDKDGKVLWAATVAPLFRMIPKQKVTEIKGNALVTRGTLRKTKKIIIHIRGGMSRY